MTAEAYLAVKVHLQYHRCPPLEQAFLNENSADHHRKYRRRARDTGHIPAAVADHAFSVAGIGMLSAWIEAHARLAVE